MTFHNRLATETSPYLQQHATNPVDWYPWGQEALDKAKRENKPLLVSIGYSACHWCHVMAHESFADPETAERMNRLFVNVKVDREERPDLDKIYQTAHFVLTENPGGWPLTVFLDPEHHLPFFTGTYFPKQARYPLPAFMDLLQRVADFYQAHHQDITIQSRELLRVLKQSQHHEAAREPLLNLQPWEQAISDLTQFYDPVYGGFGDAPKFPNSTYLNLFFQDSLLGNHNSRAQLDNTLQHMANGGIYDQLGGGFFRYSVDSQWNIPHFEKMLYDNAQLLLLYVQAAIISPQPLRQKIVQETADWVIRDMQAPEGGYYAALDADSEGKEGLFYLWTAQEVEQAVSAEQYRRLLLYFNLQQAPNFENYWHLHVVSSPAVIAQQLSESVTATQTQLNAAIHTLWKSRQQRPAVHRDEKILTAWNALMIKAMLVAGVQTSQPAYLTSATCALEFIYNHLWQNQRLFAVYKDGLAHLAGYLDDYAFLLDALLTYLQWHWDARFFTFACAIADVLVNHFVDSDGGGFYFVADDHEALAYRPKIWEDNVQPAGIGVACLALQRLGYLAGDFRYLTVAEKTIKMSWPMLEKNPSAYGTLLQALREFLQPPEIMIIRAMEPELSRWQEMVRSYYSPSRLVFAIPSDETALPANIAEKKPVDNKAVAYICLGFQCQPPITEITLLEQYLK